MDYTAGSSSLEPALITKQAGIVKKGVSACQQFCGDALDYFETMHLSCKHSIVFHTYFSKAYQPGATGH